MENDFSNEAKPPAEISNEAAPSSLAPTALEALGQSEMTTPPRTSALRPPFHWHSKEIPGTLVSSFKVVEAPECIRIEIYSPVHMGERQAANVQVPFLPRALHADCMSVEDHAAEMALEIKDAVAEATAEATQKLETATKKIVQMEQRVTHAETSTRRAREQNTETLKAQEAEMEKVQTENALLKRQNTLGSAVVAAFKNVPLTELTLRNRQFITTAGGVSLRQALHEYSIGKFPEFVAEHKLTEEMQEEIKTKVEAAKYADAEGYKTRIAALESLLEACASILSADGTKHVDMLTQIDDAMKKTG